MRIYEKLLLGTCLICPDGVPGQAKDQPVKMADLPPAVQAMVKELSKGAKLRGLSKEVQNGRTLYEAETIVNGHGKDFELDSTGAVVEVEDEVPLASLPEAARTAIEKGAGGGKVLKVESVTQGSSVVAYEAKVSKEDKRSQVRVDPEGKPAPEQ